MSMPDETIAHHPSSHKKHREFEVLSSGVPSFSFGSVDVLYNFSL
jgi:hypothetical protein